MTMIEAPDAPFRLTTPIEHITKLDDGSLVIHCTATSEHVDSQGEIVDYDAAKAAAPDFLKWATLTEMHDGTTSPGTALRLFFNDEGRYIEADLHVVDPVAVRKVLSRTYKAVSIGGVKLATQLVQIAGRTVRRITKLRWEELALVTRPANPDALITKQFVLAKREEPPMTDDQRTPEQAAIDATREEMAKAEAADADVGGGRVRSNIPKEDFVFPEDAPDGGFPIAAAGDVSDAVSSWGRYKGPHTFDEFKSRLTSIATRLGFASSLPSAWKKESKKMAKKAAQAAQAAQTIVKADAPPPDEPTAPGDAAGEAPPPAFPGAKPPFTGKKAARKARKAARAAKAAKVTAFAKGNKTIKDLAEAYEAVMCAIQEEADEGDQDGVKALQAIADSIHECMSAEAAEPDGGDDQDDDSGGVEAEFDPELAMSYAKGQRRLAASARGLAKRLAKARRSNGRLRKSARKLRKERAELRKAAVLTSVLTKAGSRNSKSDLAKIDAIHEATVDLGTTAHKAPVVADATADTPLAKAETSATIMRDALKDLVPARQLEAIEARLIAIDAKSAAQGEQLAKIAKSPTGGGPASSYAAILRGPAEVTDKASALEKAAEIIDDPRLKEQVGEAASLEAIRRLRAG